MNKTGEIARFNCGSYLYVMSATKYLSCLGDAIWLDFFISRRTSKKRGMKDKYLSKYALGTDGGIKAIRYFLTFLIQYLDKYKPEYLAICPAEDENQKRTDFYARRLYNLGYYYIGKDKDENGFEKAWVDMYRRYI